jgi:hypothetical protein
VGWHEVLDDIETRLTDVDRQLTTAGPAVPPFELPDDLGPLPADLRHRAERALRETRRKQLDAEAARDKIADALHRGRTTTREPPAYLDTWI